MKLWVKGQMGYFKTGVGFVFMNSDCVVVATILSNLNEIRKASCLNSIQVM